MHIPSEKIRKEMYSENASIWYSFANGGEELAVLIKVPTVTIKSLIMGCPLTLTFGKKDIYFCTGVEIKDIPEKGVLVSGIQHEFDQYEALLQVLKKRKFPLFLFNEADFCVAWTNCEIIETDSNKLIDFMGDISKLYVGPHTEETNYALDCFCNSIEGVIRYANAPLIPIIKIEPKIDKWTINNLHFFGFENLESVSIDDKDEGETFERIIWVSLQSVFPTTLYKNPQTISGEKKREFVDVLSFYEYGAFLFEAKDLSVLNAGITLDMDRRVKNLKKQIKKAINQLVGATKVFKNGELITNQRGQELIISRRNPPHCIILVTELLIFDDYSEIVDQLLQAIYKTGAYFHILDLRELISLLKGSSGDARLLDYNLIKRFEFLVKNKTIYIRSVPAPK